MSHTAAKFQSKFLGNHMSLFVLAIEAGASVLWCFGALFIHLLSSSLFLFYFYLVRLDHVLLDTTKLTVLFIMVSPLSTLLSLTMDKM